MIDLENIIKFCQITVDHYYLTAAIFGFKLNLSKFCLEVRMFGLPGVTAAVLFGFPIFWIVYTIIFFVKSKDWPEDVETEEEGGSSNG